MNTPEPAARDASASGDDQRLEQMLPQAASIYIDDAGFTAQIMGALPAPGRRAEWRRNGLLLGAMALGCGLSAVLGGSDSIAFVATMMDRLVAWSALPVPGFESALTVGVLACWIMTMAAGWWAWSRMQSPR
jgi:hypothetical protein